MRVLLCGYHEAGYRALRTLVGHRHDILVATHPSPPELPSMTALARSLNIDFVDGDLHEVHQAAREFAPDLILSVYYRFVLPTDTLRLASCGAYNFHPALLPKHRGSFSAPWAIIDNDEVTGVTCHEMIEQVDAGDIVDTITLPIAPDDLGMTLYYKLVDAAEVLFERVLKQLQRGDVRGTPQAGDASFHKRELPYGGVIDPAWPRDRIDRFIRALYFPPYPPAAVLIDGTRHPVCSLDEYDRIARNLSTAAARA